MMPPVELDENVRAKGQPSNNENKAARMYFVIPEGTLIKNNPCDDACVQQIFFGPEKNGDVMKFGRAPLWGGMWPERR